MIYYLIECGYSQENIVLNKGYEVVISEKEKVITTVDILLCVRGLASEVRHFEKLIASRSMVFLLKSGEITHMLCRLGMKKVVFDGRTSKGFLFL
ncbi:hypothetical protein [Thermodesulfovibrio sp. 3462-1]|uniref:Uncharacterized protein n=1 Tax=Thermodesulfovibrio obliviosus TaxID=3118332 RepID=A0AAU8H1G3_9BACT